MARKSKEQIQKEKATKATVKHIKEHYRRFEIQLHNERQKDIIEHLEKQPNKKQYIISLILKDMQQQNKSDD